MFFRPLPCRSASPKFTWTTARMGPESAGASAARTGASFVEPQARASRAGSSQV